MLLTFAHLSGGELPYDSAWEYFYPAAFVFCPLVIGYTYCMVAKQVRPIWLDSLTTVALVWAVDSLTKMQMVPWVIFGAYFGLSFWCVVGCVVGGITYLAIRDCIKRRSKRDVGMIVGFVIGMLITLARPVLL